MTMVYVGRCWRHEFVNRDLVHEGLKSMSMTAIACIMVHRQKRGYRARDMVILDLEAINLLGLAMMKSHYMDAGHPSYSRHPYHWG